MILVTVYRLNDDGKWDDQGTGHITVDYLERSEDLGLHVIDEEDNETLLLHRICSEDIYRKQDDTIISWRDPDSAIELALSFREISGCTYIWENICNLQRNMHFSPLTKETFHSMNSEVQELPPVELSTLPLILKTVVESRISDQLRVIDLILQDQEFFSKLIKLFRDCEDLGNIDGLHLIYKIVRGIISLNSSPLFEKILGDDFIMDIIGCLEYDPEKPRVHHRDFLKDNVVFKEVIPIRDPVVISKIHQTYRVGYLKDVILAKTLDDAVMAYLNSIVLSNNAFVVSLLKDDTIFVKDLFTRLKSSATSVDSKKTLVCFLHEFFILSKSLQMVHQIQLLRDFVSEGLFDVVTEILQSEDRKLALTGAEIIMQSVTLDPNILRPYVDRQSDGILLGLLVRNMLSDYGENMHCQFYELVRNLLDANVSGSQNGTVIEVFYEKHFSQLINAIISSCSSRGDSLNGNNTSSSIGGSQVKSTMKPEILLNIADLLCFCVLQHPYRIKCNFLLNNVVEKVLFLTRRKEKYLVVAAVRFFRTLLVRSDEHLMNHLVKNDLFKLIIDVFVANGDRYNLLNSAVLDLFEHIRKENLKILIRHLVDAFWSELVKFERFAPIRDLRVKYEQSLECASTKNTVDLLEQRKRVDERALEKEEEDYFNEDSDEEDSASTQTTTTNKDHDRPPSVAKNSPPSAPPSTRPGGLVDYADDEDDEDFHPPPPKRNADASNEEEELVKGSPSKRKLASKDEPEQKRLRNGSKPKRREGVFVALCQTLSGVVLPNKKSAPNSPQAVTDDPKSSSNTGENAETDEKRGKEEVSLSGGINESASVNEKDGSEHPLLPSDSSPEMTVNGS